MYQSNPTQIFNQQLHVSTSESSLSQAPQKDKCCIQPDDCLFAIRYTLVKIHVFSNGTFVSFLHVDIKG